MFWDMKNSMFWLWRRWEVDRMELGNYVIYEAAFCSSRQIEN